MDEVTTQLEAHEAHEAHEALSRNSRRDRHRHPLTELPPAVYPGRHPMEGPRVVLEPLDSRVHTEALYQISHEDELARALWEYLPYGPFHDSAAMKGWLRDCSGAADPVFYALVDKAEGVPMGMASFLEIRPAVGVIEIGHIWFAPPYQSTVQTTEALFLMMSMAMDTLANRRLEWKCNALNLDSRRAALRLGFRYEGVFFNHNVVKGCNRDTSWFSIIDSEWAGVRENFSQWLDPNNFDATGQQRKSLGNMNRALWSTS